MKTDGGITSQVHVAGHTLMRHFPALRQWTRRYYYRLEQWRYQRIANSIATDSSVIFFESYLGRNYACSPRAIYEAMLADPRFADCTFVWSFKEGYFPDVSDADSPLAQAALVQRGTQAYYEALAVAGTMVLNARLPEYVVPKPDQVFVQCWHGTPLKRLGYDVQVETTNVMNTTAELAARFGLDAQKWTYLLSPSPYTSLHLADAFGVSKERRANVVLEVGYPRNDELVLKRDDEAARDAARVALGVPAGKKVMLYAPTWRDDHYTDGLGYSMDVLVDFNELQGKLGSDWVVLFRAHYYIANSFDFAALDGFVIDVSKAGDINQLYLASDVLVTDYSSVMFDYANLHRPIVLSCPDIDEYAGATRGFYFDINQVPGPLCLTTDELAGALQKLDTYQEDYGAEYDAFCEQFCPLDDGHASERVLDVLAG